MTTARPRTKPLRPGDLALDSDPGGDDPMRLCIIGHLRTPWGPDDCPKNLTQARERGGSFAALIDAPFRPGLQGLVVGQPIILLYWTAAARRDLIVQSPAHRQGATGVFSLRSPARPNPVAVAVTRLVALDLAMGLVGVDALDAFDGTPLLDIKPWLSKVDIPTA